MEDLQNDQFKKILELRAKINLNEITELEMCPKSVLKKYMEDINTIDPASVIKIQAIIDYMYEQVNIGNWKEVKPYIRKTITIASYLRLIAHLKCNKLSDNILNESFKIIDFGILFGCPIDGDPKLLQNCAKILYSSQSTAQTIADTNTFSLKPEDVHERSKSYNCSPISFIAHPSMEHFYKNCILTDTPVILNDCINHWPALEKWKDANYFLKTAGLRTVSIELGSSYTDTNWTQKLMTIEEFIKQHLFQNEGPTGYLAQYQLFEHIPELREDIIEPEYCCFSDNDDPVEIMAWYGPKGTISPLHHDPKRNLLAQVIGQKQIFLFSPKESSYLHPHEHELLDNTSKIDPRKPDLEKYPEFKNAKAYYCVLSPGQMLYIPPKWWHYVESLSISFSVSFWWD